MAIETVILVVDDERNHADGVAEALEKSGQQIVAVYSGKDALEIIRNQQIDIVITDLKLGGDIDGLDILNEAKKINSQTEVVLMTAYATIDTCKDAMKQGAYDYLIKPIDIDQLRTVVEQLTKRNVIRNHVKSKTVKKDFEFEGVIGKGSKMTSIFNVLQKVAPTDISVLIEGQSGTGKELLARAIHKNSQRWNKAFNPINCAGLTETLLESELFGHVKGAYTGATSDRKGLFELADRGTLFLDEIGDMPLNMQAKLLRVLEDGVVMPVGSSKSVTVDVRIISATNHDLTKLIEEKKFRQDLYFRIKGVSITLPSLKDRREDMASLIDQFIKEAATETGSKIIGMTESAKTVLTNFDWPGNIRQLRNCIRTMVVMCDSDQLDIKDIPPEIHHPRQLLAADNTAEAMGTFSLNELEKQAIIDTLAKTNNNREKTASILGIGERTLYRKIKEYNI